MSHKILIVEDDKEIINLLKINLQDMGYDVELAFEGRSGLEKAKSKNYDLLILDLMLPGVDGLEICRQVRSQTSYTPILMLTCRSSELDRVLGLEMGADDYLTKPFSIKELLARVKALFRRIEALQSQTVSDKEKKIAIADLLIDAEKRKVTQNEKPVNLTAKEFDLLYKFAQNPGRVYTRSQLLDAVWGTGFESYEHTVNSHINRLRAKIESDPTQPRYILTVWGVGYKFSDELSEV
ncbi:MAG: response regulator transcription factor [Proteobacteria bacterium]|nr:response regulator transcription factor [Pseudomonadota bacterium]